MADFSRRLFGPVALGSSAATVYTVPATYQGVPVVAAQLVDLQICNETGTAATFTMSVGTDGAGKRLFMAWVIPANEVRQRTGLIELDPGEILQMYSGTASALTVTGSGVIST